MNPAKELTSSPAARYADNSPGSQNNNQPAEAANTATPGVPSQPGLPKPDKSLVRRRTCTLPECNKLILKPPYMQAVCCGATYHPACLQKMLCSEEKCAGVECGKVVEEGHEDRALLKDIDECDWSDFIFSKDQPPHPEKLMQKRPAPWQVEVKKKHGRTATSKPEQGPAAPGHEINVTGTGIFTPGLDAKSSELSLQEKATEKTVAAYQSSAHDDVKSVVENAPAQPQRQTTLPEDPALILHPAIFLGGIEQVLGVQPHQMVPPASCAERLNREGVVPGWTAICQAKKKLPGKLVQLRSGSGDINHFFSSLSVQLRKLPPDKPFFFAFLAKDSIQPIDSSETRYVMRVARIVRESAESGKLVLLATHESQGSEGESRGRLQCISAKDDDRFVQHLKSMIYMSLSPRAFFVRPTTRGETREVSLQDIPVEDISHTCQPFDLMPSTLAIENPLKFLQAVALIFSLQRVSRPDTEQKTILQPLLLPGVRSFNTSKEIVAQSLIDNGFLPYGSDVKSISFQDLPGVKNTTWEEFQNHPEQVMDSPHISEEDFLAIHSQKTAVLRQQVVDWLMSMAGHDRGYITVHVRSDDGTNAQDSYCIAFDKGNFFLVTMNNPKRSVLTTRKFGDLVDYLKVMMAGRRAISVQLCSYVFPESEY